MPDVDLPGYRDRVDVVARELGHTVGTDGLPAAVAGLAEDDDLTAVLAHHPRGVDHVLAGLTAQLAGWAPGGRSTASSPVSLARVSLLHQVDVLWWGSAPAYRTSAEVDGAPELVDLDVLRAAGRLRFGYRGQATTLAARAVRAAERRLAPGRAPAGAGLRYRRARPEAVALLNEVAAEVAAAGPCPPDAVWLNSAVRSEAHQAHLRELGYSALTPSSHCSGYAVDVAVEWAHRRDVGAALTRALLRRRDDGEVNVIDEGPVWHVCLSPAAVPALRHRAAADGGVG